MASTSVIVNPRQRSSVLPKDILTLLRDLVSLNPCAGPSKWKEVKRRIYERTKKKLSAKAIKNHVEYLVDMWIIQGQRSRRGIKGLTYRNNLTPLRNVSGLNKKLNCCIENQIERNEEETAKQLTHNSTDYLRYHMIQNNPDTAVNENRRGNYTPNATLAQGFGEPSPGGKTDDMSQQPSASFEKLSSQVQQNSTDLGAS